MITAIITTLLESIGAIFWKKSLGYKISNRAHDLVSYSMGGVLLLYLIYTGISFPNIDFLLVTSVFCIFCLYTIKNQLSHKVFQEEKMSVILPYTNVNKILIISSGFFLFNDVSVTSLIITFIAILVIILSSIDFKNHSIPKNLPKILITEVFLAIAGIWSGWVIINYSDMTYFIMYVIIGFISLFLMVIFTRHLSDYQHLPSIFWKDRFIASVGWIGWFLSLGIISKLGLSISVLLSFLGIGITLLLSFFILKDKPSKKDLILTIVITGLVGLGFYFK